MSYLRTKYLELVIFVALIGFYESRIAKDLKEELVYGWTYPLKYTIKKSSKTALICNSKYKQNTTITWMKDNVKVFSAKNQKSLIYHIQNAELIDNGCYKCVVHLYSTRRHRTEWLYSTEKETCITVATKPIFEEGKTFETIYFNSDNDDPITLSCRASSLIAIDYYWYGPDIGSETTINQENLEEIVVQKYMKDRDNFYTCIAKNYVGESRKYIRLLPYPKLSKPSIIYANIININVVQFFLTAGKFVKDAGRPNGYMIKCGSADTVLYENAELTSYKYAIPNFIKKVNCSISIYNEKTTSAPTYIQLHEPVINLDTALINFINITMNNITLNYEIDDQEFRALNKPNMGLIKIELLNFNLKMIQEKSIKSSKGTIIFTKLAPETGYIINLVSLSQFFNKTYLTSQVYVYTKPSLFYLNQTMYYKLAPKIKAISVENYVAVHLTWESQLVKPEFRLVVCEEREGCTTSKHDLVFANNIKKEYSVVILKLKPNTQYDIMVKERIPEYHLWILSESSSITTFVLVPEMPKNVVIKNYPKYITVSFEENDSMVPILGTTILIEYTDSYVKYYVKLGQYTANITKREGWNVFIVKVYHFNDNGSGSAYVKYLSSKIENDQDDNSGFYIAVTMFCIPVIFILIALSCCCCHKFRIVCNNYERYNDSGKHLLKENEDYQKEDNDLDLGKPMLSNMNPKFEYSLSTKNFNKDVISFNNNTLNTTDYAFNVDKFNQKMLNLQSQNNQELKNEYASLFSITSDCIEPKSTCVPIVADVKSGKNKTVNVKYTYLTAPLSMKTSDFFYHIFNNNPSLLISLDCPTNIVNEIITRNNDENQDNSLQVIIKSTSYLYGCILKTLQFEDNFTGKSVTVKYVEYTGWIKKNLTLHDFGSMAELQRIILRNINSSADPSVMFLIKSNTEKCLNVIVLNQLLANYKNENTINIIRDLSLLSINSRIMYIKHWRGLQNIYYVFYEMIAYNLYEMNEANYNRHITLSEYQGCFQHLYIKDTYLDSSEQTINNYMSYLCVTNNVNSLSAESVFTQKKRSIVTNVLSNNMIELQFLVVNTPIKIRRSDFFKLLYSNQCSLIVSLDNFESTLEYISPSYLEKFEDIALNEFEVSKISEESNMSLFNKPYFTYKYSMRYKSQPNSNLLVMSIGTNNMTTNCIKQMAEFCYIILTIQKKMFPNKPIIVHNQDGYVKSSIFIACCQLIEIYNKYDTINIPLTIRNILRQFPFINLDITHYKTIFEVTKFYIGTIKDYIG